MKKELQHKVLLLNPNDSIKSVITKMGKSTGEFFGIGLIVSSDNCLKGVINNRDLINLIADEVDLNLPISTVMIKNPISVKCNLTNEEIVREVRSQSNLKYGNKKSVTRYVPLVDDNGLLVDIIDMYDVLIQLPKKIENIKIYGLGFVGITLAVSLASRGHFVTGIDSNKILIKNLKCGKLHVFEPFLEDMLNQSLSDGFLRLNSTSPHEHHRISIIAVGTPVTDDGSAHLDDLKAVCIEVGNHLKRGDLVMLRSTIPVGTTREFVKKVLEDSSKLKPGLDFGLAFTPERTAEGQAMQELITLPQIVGGLTKNCLQSASSFWQNLSNSIVNVESLEAAELVKLLNNSFRDLSFAFANSFALLADRFNLDANKVILAANEGYPRNPIPRPSPGVGGYCLTKDPFLYGAIDKSASHSKLSKMGRKINELTERYPLKVLESYALSQNLALKDLTIFVLGITFKGIPETNDIRGSSSIEFINLVSGKVKKVLVYDAVLSNKDIIKLGLKPASINEGAKQCDALMILNNHPKNAPNGLIDLLKNKSVLIFDGWSLLDKYLAESVNTITYSTMGYMSNRVKN